MLRSLPARPGDAIFIPGGRLHAIGAGCLLLEIQQSSNTTYRVYDWERTGRGGPGRQMHLKQALAAIRWDDTALPLLDRRQGRRSKGNACAELCRCDFFVVQRLDLAGPLVTENDGSSFHALFVESGTATLDGGGRAETLAAGRSCLAPAAVTPYTLTPDRAATVIRVSLP
jgi:mannose-6-phosphate isomerase